MSTAKEVLEEEYHRNIARQRTIHEAKESLRNDDLQGAIIYTIRALEMLSASEERVMRLHAECVSMLEHAGKVLELEAMRRPLVVQAVLSPGGGSDE